MSTNSNYKDYFLPLKDKAKEKSLFDQLVNLCMDFYSGKTRDGKFLQYKSSEELKEMVSEQLHEAGLGLEKMMKVLEDPIGKYSIAQFDKDYFAFPDSGNAIPTIFADIYSKFLNQNMIAVSRSAPIATFVEIQLIEWLRQLIGFEYKSLDKVNALSEVSGMVTSGGHMSNHVAMLAALNSNFPQIKKEGLSSLDFQPAVIMAGDISHYSHTSAAHHLGIGQDAVLLTKSTSEYKTSIKSVEELLKNPPKGKKPFMVIGVAGNSRTTSIDDLEELAKVCKKYSVWFHVDACHGGNLLFSKKYLKLFKGIKIPHSISLYPHKNLFSPYPISFTIFKKRDTLVQFTRYEDKVRQGLSWDLGYINPFYGSRGFESLKVWLLIKTLGMNTLGKIVDDREILAKYCHTLINKSGYFCILNDMDFYRMTFVYYPKQVKDYVNSSKLSIEQKNNIKKIIDEFTHEINEELYTTGELCLDEFQLFDLGNFTGLESSDKFVIMSITLGNPTQDKKNIKRALGKLLIKAEQEEKSFFERVRNVVDLNASEDKNTIDELHGPAGWK